MASDSRSFASAIFARSPPESTRTRLNTSSPRMPSLASTVRAVELSQESPFTALPSAVSSMSSVTAWSWSNQPIRARGLIRISPQKRVPGEGSPRRARSSVVFPLPLSPTSAVFESVGSVIAQSRISARPPASSTAHLAVSAVFARMGSAAPSSMRMSGRSLGRSFFSSRSSLSCTARFAALWRSTALVYSRVCRRASLLPMRFGAFLTEDAHSAFCCASALSRACSVL